MVDRNTIVGIDLLTVGLVASGLGYIGAQSIPIAAFGFGVAIIGALILLLVPEPVPQDAYKALLKDSIKNIEIILEESQLKERAYFIPTDEDDSVSAFIPIVADAAATTTTSSSSANVLLSGFSNGPRRFITNYGDLRGLVLVPPGNEIARLAKVRKGDDLEESLRSALVGFSDLASSVISVEEGSTVKIQIKGPKLSAQSPFFNDCLGSPLSSIACCVTAKTKGVPVKILDEKHDSRLVRLTLEAFQQ